MYEQRLTVRLLKYWNMVRSTTPVPKIERFNVEPIMDLWQQCFLVSVDARLHVRYKYEYIGPLIVEAYGNDLTGYDVDAKATLFPGVVMYKKLAEVLEGRLPVEDEGFFMTETSKLIKYRACFLPFGREDKAISHIVVGLSFRVF